MRSNVVWVVYSVVVYEIFISLCCVVKEFKEGPALGRGRQEHGDLVLVSNFNLKKWHVMMIWGGGGVTVHGGWFQGSPSICIGNCFLVRITICEHWARRFPDERNPVRTCEGREDYFWSILLTILTCPMWRQFSRPMTSINLSPISWLAPLRSIRSPRLELLDSSPSFFTFFLLNFDLESPHMLVPPWVEGMLRRAMPCSWGPPVRGSDTPSHWNIRTLAIGPSGLFKNFPIIYGVGEVLAVPPIRSGFPDHGLDPDFFKEIGPDLVQI